MKVRSLLICVFAAACGSAVGWWWHRQREVSATIVATASTTPKAVAAETSVTRDEAAITTGPFASLAAQLSTSPRIQRWLLLVAAVEKARVEQLPELLRICGEDRNAQRMIAARWATLDPAHMWRTLMKWPLGEKPGGGLSTSEYAELLLDVWIPRDREAALAALTKDRLGGVNGVASLRMDVLQRLFKDDPAGGLDLMAQWNIKHYGPDLVPLAKWMEQHPQLAAEKVAKLTPSYSAAMVMSAVGAAWAKTDPAAALQHAATLSASRRTAMAEGIMKTWAKQDAAAAAAHVTTIGDPALRTAMALPLIETWAKAEPQAALDWAQDHLRGEARASAIGKLVVGLAAQDTPRAAELVKQLDPGGAQNKAVNALVGHWLEKSKGREAAQWLLTLPAGEAREQGFDELGMRWFWNDGSGLKQALQLTTGPQRDTLSPGFIAHVAGAQGRTDPAAAMTWANNLAPAQQNAARERILNEWISSRPETAAQWVLDQPAGPGRADLIASVTRQLSWQPDSTAVKKFLTQLPAADHAAAREAFSGLWRPTAEQAKLLEMLGK